MYMYYPLQFMNNKLEVVSALIYCTHVNSLVRLVYEVHSDQKVESVWLELVLVAIRLMHRTKDARATCIYGVCIVHYNEHITSLCGHSQSILSKQCFKIICAIGIAG